MKSSDRFEDVSQVLTDHRDQYQARGWLWLIVILILITAAIGAYWQYRSQTGPRWMMVAAWHPGITFPAVEKIREWGQTEKNVSMPAGKPYQLEPGHWLALPGIFEPDDVRISVDAEWTERIDAIELAVRADSEATPAWWMVPRGVSCQFGGYSGVESSLSLNREPGPHMRQITCPAAMRVSQRYVFTLESSGGTSRMLQDGMELANQPELTPLGGTAANRIAIRAWAPIVIHGIRVERLRTGAEVPVMRVGDALMRHGAQEPAIAWYKRIADEHAGTPLAATALAKLAACAAIGPDQGNELQKALDRISKEYPEDPLRERVESIVILQRWRRRDYDGALTMMEMVQQRNPMTRLPLTLVSERPGLVPSPHGKRLATTLLRVPGLRQLDLSGLDLHDISWLAGRPLNDLNLSDNPLSDLSALVGMPLERLRINATRVSDLSPLKGMPLRIFAMVGTKVTDLSPLANLRLESIDCSYTDIADLAPLQGQPLRTIWALGTRISSLVPVAQSPLLDVRISESPVTDLSPLKGKELTFVDVSRCPVDNIEGVAGPRLEVLDATGTQVHDLSPLRVSSRLRELRLGGTPVRDIEPLAGLPLEDLILDDTKVDDLSALKGASLEHLSLRDALITSIAPLAGVPLRRLNLVGTKIESVNPLSRSPLHVLDIGGAPVTDLPSLAQVYSLEYLGLGSSERPGMNELASYYRTVGRHDLARIVQISTERIRSPERLRGLADTINGRQRLALGIDATWEEANAIAAAAGAYLVCPQDRVDLRAILTSGGFRQCEIWSGLRLRDGALSLPDGADASELMPAGAVQSDGPIHIYWTDAGQGCAWSSGRSAQSRKLVMLEWPR